MIHIGVDIGGTGIQTGLVSENLEIVAESSIQTRQALPFSDQIRQIAEAMTGLLLSSHMTWDDVASVGIGIPGIASHSGEVIKCTNMGWYHVPFASELKKYIDKPVYIDNDANVAALAESKAGVSAGTSSSVFITIGTGIGSGIIINGKIWKGFHGIGAELGHTVMDLDGVPCTCGNHGCLERYCSATAIIRMGLEALQSHPESIMQEWTGGNKDAMNAKIVFDAAKAGDLCGQEVFNRFISYLSQAIVNVINFLDPEVIVLGGGVSKAGTFLLDALRVRIPHFVLYNDQPMPEIMLARLGSEAGIIGAAMLD